MLIIMTKRNIKDSDFTSQYLFVGYIEKKQKPRIIKIIKIKIKANEDYFSYFHFALKIHFYVKMKIRGITSIGLDKYFSKYDPKQYS